MVNYPTSLDTTGAGTLETNHADGISEIIHASDINDHSTAIVALETKLGVGASTPTSGLVLTGGTTAGTSSWQTPASVTALAWQPGLAFKSMFGTLKRGATPNAAKLTTNAIAGLYDQTSVVAGLPEATTSLASQLAGLSSGQTVTIAPGIYRESYTVSVTNVTLKASGDVSIRGSDWWQTSVWSTAPSPNAANGIISDTSHLVPAFATETDVGQFTGGGAPTIQASPEQVFVDGIMYTRKADNATLAAGEWCLNNSAAGAGQRRVIIYLAGGASGHKIEVTTRQSWIVVNQTGLTIDGIDFRHAASYNNQSAPFQNNSKANTVMQNCMASYTHGLAAAWGGSSGGKCIDTVFANCGTIGIDTASETGFLVEGCVFFNCGGSNRRYSGALDGDGYDENWGSGGIKIVGDYGTIAECFAWNLGSNAYWFDVLCRYGAIYNNVAWDCRGSAVHYEVSSYFRIWGNHVFQTASTQFGSGFIGINVSSSRDGDLGPDLFAGQEPNIVMRVGTAYKVGWQMTRTDLPPSGTTNRLSGGFRRVRVHDNIAILRKVGGQGPGGNDLAIQWAELSGSGASVGTATTSESGTTATYTVANNLLAGQLVTVTGCSVAGYNVTNATVVTATATNFTLTLGVSGLGAGTGAVVVTGNGSSIADSSNTGWHVMVGFENATDNVTGMTWPDDFIFYSDVTGLPGQSGGYVLNITDWRSGRWDTGTDDYANTRRARYLTYAEQACYLNMYGLPMTS